MEDSTRVAWAAEAELGPKDEWAIPAGYPESLALCIVDSVFSLRAHYSGVEKVMARYSSHRLSHGGNARTDGASDLLATIEGVGGPELAVTTLFNNSSVAPGTAVPKAVAVAQGAAALQAAGVDDASHLREATDATLELARKNWRAVRGLGPASWDYLLMLVGRGGVKADTWIVRFVSRVLGERVTFHQAHRAVHGAATLLNVEPFALDHRIWRHESGRLERKPSQA